MKLQQKMGKCLNTLSEKFHKDMETEGVEIHKLHILVEESLSVVKGITQKKLWAQRHAIWKQWRRKGRVNGWKNEEHSWKTRHGLKEWVAGDQSQGFTRQEQTSKAVPTARRLWTSREELRQHWRVMNVSPEKQSQTWVVPTSDPSIQGPEQV